MSNVQHTNHNTLKTNSAPISSQDFTIGDHALVIDMLINKYKYPIQTCVQEYLCNARDAMREIGNTAPIDITYPTRLNGIFKVRDYGPGLSADRVKNIFTVFGNSTKRKSAKQTGGFGIGAKSAWAYTDAFTIVTYVNGKEEHYIAHRGKTRSGALDHVYSGTTSEPNGTEIQIAVSPNDITDFKDAINRALYFWKQPVNVKGCLDKLVVEKGIKVGKYLELFEYDQVDILNNTNLLIDGVLYELDHTYRNKIDSLDKIYRICKQVTISIGNELVEVLASREDINPTEYTIKNLTTVCDQALAELNSYITNQFSILTTPFEFVNTYKELNSIITIPSNFAKWQSYSIGGYLDKIDHPNFKLLWIDFITNKTQRSRSDTKIKTTNQQYIRMDDINNLYYSDIEETKVIRNRRYRKIMETDDLDILMVSKGKLTDAQFKDFIKLFKVKPISSLALPDKVPSKPRVVVSRDKKQFCLHTWNTTVWTSLADNTTEYLYFEHNSKDRFSIRQLSSYIGKEIVGLSVANIKRVKGNSNFKPLDKFIKDYKLSKLQLLAHSEKFYTSILEYMHTNLTDSQIKISTIKDKSFRDLLNQYGKVVAAVNTVGDDNKYIPSMLLDDEATLRAMGEYANKEIDRLEKLYPISFKILRNEYGPTKENIKDAIEFINFKQRKNNA